MEEHWVYDESLDKTPLTKVHKLTLAERLEQGRKDRGIGYRDEHLRSELSGPKRRAYDRGNRKS